MFKKIERWYACGLWTAEMVRLAAAKGLLTQSDAADILGGGADE